MGCIFAILALQVRFGRCEIESVDYYAIFTAAFLGSLGHCIGMCGGIVLAYSTLQNGQRILAHILYNLGRTSSYIALGAVFGALGAVVAASTVQRGLLFVCVGILMMIFALLIAIKPRILAMFEVDISRFSIVARLFKKLLQGQSMVNFYGLGVLNGFLPCGFVYFFALSAASSASIFYGALSMGIFALATIPALFALGFFASMIIHSSWRGLFMRLSAFVVAIFGLYTTLKGYYLIIDPSGLNTPKLLGCTLC